MDRPYRYLKMVSAVMDVSMSQVINDVLEYLSENVDETKIWDDWKEDYKEFQALVEEAGEEESEDKDESEDEDESEDGDEEEEGEDESEAEDEEDDEEEGE